MALSRLANLFQYKLSWIIVHFFAYMISHPAFENPYQLVALLHGKNINVTHGHTYYNHWLIFNGITVPSKFLRLPEKPSAAFEISQEATKNRSIVTFSLVGYNEFQFDAGKEAFREYVQHHIQRLYCWQKCNNVQQKTEGDRTLSAQMPCAAG